MFHSKSIGNKMTEARKKANLSQAELAQQISISSQAVGKWERGESLPDITTLNRVAEILGVDLNYFSERFPSSEKVDMHNEFSINKSTESESLGQKLSDTKVDKKQSWDMSRLNLLDSDFSGLNNLRDKFSSSNIQRCLFIGSQMSGIVLNSNNIDRCDFSDSDISNCQFQNSNLDNTKFNKCSLKETEFTKCNIGKCDFSESDFTKSTFKLSNFGENNITKAIWKSTTFVEMQLQDVVFDGIIDGCFFEHCTFYNVKFQNATLINTFFKNNKKFNRVKFIDCKVDKLTYAFLKSNLANLSGTTLIS